MRNGKLKITIAALMAAITAWGGLMLGGQTLTVNKVPFSAVPSGASLWVAHTDEETDKTKNTSEAPDSVETKDTQDTPDSDETNDTPEEESGKLPSSYKTETTPIREQGSYNTCWAFSGLGALEATLSRDGRGDFDFSEQHLSWWSTKAYNSDGIGWLSPGLSYGGYSMISAGYLASWQGPKTEVDIPYRVSNNTSVPDNMEGEYTPFGVTGIVYVPNDIESVKAAVYKYGGVATSFQNGSGYGENKANYYQNDDVALFSGHAITIIGWDDSYSKTNFKKSAQPPYDGAWLAKNSWGTEKGDDGYIWISYYDRYILDSDIWGSNLAFDAVRTMNFYDKLYQNEIYGATYLTMVKQGDYTLPKATFANVFNFESEYPYLQEVVFETQAEGADYTVWYIPLDGEKPTGDESRWTRLSSGRVDHSGYIKADVDFPVELGGAAAIGVTIDASKAPLRRAQLGVDEWMINSDKEYIFMPKPKKNESFVIHDGRVYDLLDIYASNEDNIGGTLVIKAIAASDVIGDADDDGLVRTDDALAVLRETIGFGQLTQLQTDNCDVNFDGVITTDDALMILRRSIGLLPEF